MTAHPGSMSEMKRHSDLVESRVSDECGCPEEDWLINGIHATIHMEPVSGGHIFLDCGIWEDEKLVEAKSIEELRAAVKDWCFSIPIDNEL